MKTCILCLSAALAMLASLIHPAAAEVDISEVDACLTERLSAGRAPATCIDDAQSDCMRVDKEVPAVATLCFVEAEKKWQNGIKSWQNTNMTIRRYSSTNTLMIELNC